MTRELEKKKLIKVLSERYPVGVPRSCVKEATGGLVAPKTLANLATQGDEPAGTHRIRGRVVYPIETFADWLFAENREE